MKFHDSLPNYDWDQMLPIGVTTEQLYQAFKARLMRELASVDTVQTPYGEGERYPRLIDNPASDHMDAPPADATAGRGGRE